VFHTGMRKSALILALAVLSLPGAATAQFPAPVPGDDPLHARLMFADSSISVNNQCLVRHGALNPEYRPTYVNGRPIGFC